MEENKTHTTTFIVLGASGHLAKTKTFPALYQIFYNKLLPENFRIFGYARTQMSVEEFRAQLKPFLKGGCVGSARACGEANARTTDSSAEQVDSFLRKCFYQHGQYDDAASFAKFNEVLKSQEGGPANRVFYMALPPDVFLPASVS